MNTVYVNFSRKKHYKWSNSRYFGSITKLCNLDSKTIDVRNNKDFIKACDIIENNDKVVLVMPVYVDSIPSHVISFLDYIKDKKEKLNIYVVTCCGFYESSHTEILLNQIECFSKKYGFNYKCGLGVGGSEMLGTIRITNVLLNPVITLIVFLIVLLITRDLHTSLLSATINFIVTLSLYILWSLSLFYHSIKLGLLIKKNKNEKNIYCGLSFCFYYLFVFFASIFWIVRALYNKVSFKKMYNQIDVNNL